MEIKTEDMKIVGIACTIAIVMTIIVVLQYQKAAQTPGTIVIPAGNTYLGPSPTPESSPWHEIRGRIYPYALRVPDTIITTTFPNDSYDLVALVWNNIDPATNVLIGVDNQKKNTTIDYVRSWWQQFSSLKGVAEITQFTNASGLKGYKAKYFNSAGKTPNLDVFFEVPGQPSYMIHLASGVLPPAVFDQIVDSVSWEK